MSDPRVSPERLQQIAAKKLQQLGLTFRQTSDGRTLEGELPLKGGKVTVPGTQGPVTAARFEVEGHDRIRIVEPPLSALGVVMVFDLERVEQLEERLEKRVRERIAALTTLGQALQKHLRLRPQFDPQALALRAVVETATNAFELLAAPDVVRVVRVLPRAGAPLEIGPGFPPMRVEDLGDRVDLELHLEHSLPAMKAAAVSPAKPSAPARPQVRVEAAAPPANALALAQLAERFGPGALVSPAGPVEVWQDFVVGGARYRFTATREQGTTFAGKVLGPQGEVWADRFDLARFPGPAKLLETVLAGPAQAAPEPQEAPAAGGPQAPDHLAPHAGEHWVMNVILEKESPDEVRYVCTNVEGEPYGASRVLPRKDFDAAFLRGAGGGCRLLILIEKVEADAVIYRQCDAARVPRGNPRRLSTGVLVTTFQPEAAAY